MTVIGQHVLAILPPWPDCGADACGTARTVASSAAVGSQSPVILKSLEIGCGIQSAVSATHWCPVPGRIASVALGEMAGLWTKAGTA